ncbi:hypothetical protein CCHR01_17558 [Colletotrichum chrysophilum]|uniref:Uncharacterized protein n=1 Tax=Colletotrichum chrysophilum TaxID=1836956 RepID=A0AAD9A290_9PEZI|nr:hypothetical protein CCHR01_17558 [Colletotrichum chrysophilum]
MADHGRSFGGIQPPRLSCRRLLIWSYGRQLPILGCERSATSHSNNNPFAYNNADKCDDDMDSMNVNHRSIASNIMKAAGNLDEDSTAEGPSDNDGVEHAGDDALGPLTRSSYGIDRPKYAFTLEILQVLHCDNCGTGVRNVQSCPRVFNLKNTISWRLHLFDMHEAEVPPVVEKQLMGRPGEGDIAFAEARHMKTPFLASTPKAARRVPLSRGSKLVIQEQDVCIPEDSIVDIVSDTALLSVGPRIHTQPESIADIALQPKNMDHLVQLTTPDSSTAQNFSALYSPFPALVETGVLDVSIPLESSDCIEPGTIAKVSIPDVVNHPSVIQTCLPPMSRALRRSPPIESQLLKMAPATPRKWFLPHPSEHKETQCDQQMNVVLHEMRHNDIPDQATTDNVDVGETDDQDSTGTAHWPT